VLDCLSIIELHKAGPGYRMDGLSGRVRNEMKVKASHRNPDEIIPGAVWIIGG